MSLSENTVRATAAVSDIDRAKEFYEGKLGLSAQTGGPDMVQIYECGGGSLLQVYASPGSAGNATATVASWSVADFDAEIDRLIAAGVEFERYEEQPSDEKGVHTFGEHKVAWCRDPDGNTLAIDNGNTSY
jgi:catechol 2,3-dioxygenase-like lactoylglutathione lyase family enzyme